MIQPSPFRESAYSGPITAIGDVNRDGVLESLSIAWERGEAFGIYHQAQTNVTTKWFEFPRTQNGAAAMADFNRDGFLDIVLVSPDSTRLFTNHLGEFSPTLAGGLRPGPISKFHVADLDQDGDPDIVVQNGAFQSTYHYDASGFRHVLNEFSPWTGESFALGDIDGDGLVDFFAEGANGAIFRGTGNGHFQYWFASSAWRPTSMKGLVDLNGDGTLDAWGVGADGLTINYFSAGRYQPAVSIPVTGSLHGGGEWVDINNDGRPDFLGTVTLNKMSQFFMLHSLGNEAFQQTADPLGLSSPTNFILADFNRDGSIDIAAGRRFLSSWVAYTNAVRQLNSPPTRPRDLRATLTNGMIELSWSPPVDLYQTGGFTYNVRAGSRSGGVDIISPTSLPDGRRLLPDRGNVGPRRKLLIKVPAVRTLYWSVQAIDYILAGGPFATEQALEISLAPTFEFEGQPGDSARLWLEGEPNVTYFIEASNDLEAWWRIGSANSATGRSELSFPRGDAVFLRARYF